MATKAYGTVSAEQQKSMSGLEFVRPCQRSVASQHLRKDFGL